MFSLTPVKEKPNGYPPQRMRNEFKALQDRLFDSWPTLFETISDRELFWSLDMTETDKELVVRAEIPGFEPAELDVELRNNHLIIKAEKKPETDERDKGFNFAKRRYDRIVALPVKIEPTKVEATYRNGVLEVHMPKSEEAKSHRVPVK
jgi:HSP20 family protein